MMYINGRWLIEPEVKAYIHKLEELNAEIRAEADITKDELFRMCLEYSADMTCEHIRECKLMKVLDENKRLKEKVRKLEYEKSWIDSPERMGR